MDSSQSDTAPLASNDSPELTNPVAQRESKRLSLQFQLPSSEQIQARPRPLSIATGTPISPQPYSPGKVTIESDSNLFLTALASQERRVLELKEDLQKAEADLSRLKTQWAVHEAAKKRSEIHRLEQLRELPSPARRTFEPTPPQRSRTSLEDEPRRLRQSKGRPTQMKVFSGGRHTRALSLLSPNGLQDRQYSVSNSATIQSPQPTINMPLSAGAARPTHARAQTQSSGRDIMHSGKDLMGGIRSGLWTFIEDLKQATVGDEAVTDERTKYSVNGGTRSPIPSRRRSPVPPSPSSAVKEPEHSTSNEVSYTGSHQSDTSSQTIQTDSMPLVGHLLDEDDGWDNWDSPQPKNPRISGSEFTNTTAGSSPRTSVSSTASKDKTATEIEMPTNHPDELPWPALTKLRPGALTRTASELLNSWERSLTPPPEETGITHPASPVSAEKDTKAD